MAAASFFFPSFFVPDTCLLGNDNDGGDDTIAHRLAHFASILDLGGMTPASLMDRVSAVSGHSQGLATAAAVASVKTADELLAKAEDVLTFLVFLSARCQAATDKFLADTANIRIPPRRKKKGQQKNTPEGPAEPTVMMAVVGLTRDTIDGILRLANKAVPKPYALQLSLINGPRQFVVSGAPRLLAELRNIMGDRRIAPGEAQNRTPFSQRMLDYRTTFLPMSVPFHHPMLGTAVEQVVADCAAHGVTMNAASVHCSLYSTADGSDLKATEGDLVPELARLIAQVPVDWMSVVGAMTETSGPPVQQHQQNRPISHILDFGPGNPSPAASLTARNTEGSSIAVIQATITSLEYRQVATAPNLFTIDSLMSPLEDVVLKDAAWGSEFKPYIAKRPFDGLPFMSTKFSRVMGRRPVIVGGMTPTTSYYGIDLVAAIANAGYHVELAAGGLSRAKIFKDRISLLLTKLKPGAGIAINLLYLNAKQWAFQFPLCCQLKKEGCPIESLTVAAGVPSPDVADTIIAAMKDCGMRYVSFKPGSKDAILSVLAIAASNPDFPVVMQWTGGRGGGHHSFEDAHEPLLFTYSALRKQKNLVLVMGSGFGDSANSVPYLNGEWSKQLGYQAMPFDAILVASRLMVAKEASTAMAIKALICSKPGIAPKDQAKWEQSYSTDAGGIITVKSELGEPIHKIATRGMMLWRELDDVFFSLPRGEKRDTAIKARKAYIIKRINADFQKLYFGRKRDGRVVDLEEMTYAEVLQRMARLMFVTPETEERTEAAAVALGGTIADVRHENYSENGRWLDPTYLSRVTTFMDRSYERYAAASSIPVAQFSDELKANPAAAIDRFIAGFNGVSTAWKSASNVLETRLLCEEDVDFFLNLCATGGKPVNFVPVIDGDLSTWFKKDSLWYSEDLSAVPDSDPDRVCILQGPISNHFNVSYTESAAEILDGIYNGFLSELEPLAAGGSAAASPQPPPDQAVGGSSEFLAESLLALGERVITSKATLDGGATRLSITVVDGNEPLPTASAWFEALSPADAPSWLRSLLLTPHVGDGFKWRENPIRRLLQPTVGQTVVVTYGGKSTDDGSEGLIVRGGMSKSSKVDPQRSVIEVTVEDAVAGSHNALAVTSANILVRIHDPPILADGSTLSLRFGYTGADAMTPITEDCTSTTEAVKEFYAALWNIQENGNKVNEPYTSEVTLSDKDVAGFNAAIRRHQSSGSSEKVDGGMDMAIMIAWQPLVSALFHKSIVGNLLDLVHLDNEYTVLNSSPLVFKAGQKVKTAMQVTSISNSDSGQTVCVSGTLAEDGHAPKLGLKSSFFFRGTFNDPSLEFETTDLTATVMLDNAQTSAILNSKSWLTVVDAAAFKAATNLVFKLRSEQTGGTLVKTAGNVYVRESKFAPLVDVVAKIDFEGQTSVCPVISFVKRFEDNEGKTAFFETGGYQALTAPAQTDAPVENESYAVASLDYNPIHRHPYLASLAKLPDTIVHGMWTSAMVREVVSKWGNGNTDRVHSFKAAFTGMVPRGETLFTELKHVGMRKGRKVLEVTTCSAAGEKIVSGRAEVNAPPTAYVFTGQGSAEVGMGMELYAKSQAARTVWDRADNHLLETYGFSILDIVRKNDSELKIYFGGKRGATIRQNYIQLVTTTKEHGSQQLIPAIDLDSDSYTFRAPEGLLFATQFTQCALVLQERAIYDDLKSQEITPDRIVFAGHSLGEYASLTSAGDILLIESLVDIVFQRGLVMQKAVKRDASGRSDFGMVAANPMRVGPFFSQTLLHTVVDKVDATTKQLVQVVNYNVQDLQYVVAGHVVALETLRLVLNAFSKNPKLVEDIDAVVSKSFAEISKARAAAKAAGTPFTMTRGNATIPLPGIDVPFHSRYLGGGVPAFRNTLKSKIDQGRMKLALPNLIGNYIPNVMAKPFEATKAYAQECFDRTASPELKALLDEWDDDNVDAEAVGYVLVVELLAYQFASPVRWIETVDHMIAAGIKRFIEIGPAPTLTNMMFTTLASGELKYGPRKGFEVLFYGREDDQNEIYYNLDDQGAECTDAAAAFTEERAAATAQREADAADAYAGSSSSSPSSSASGAKSVSFQASPPAAPAPAAVPTPLLAQAPAVSMPTAASSGPLPDKEAKALDVLRVLLAIKVKKPIEEIKDDSTIAKLVGGKSALQNEIVGDLEKEFGSGPDTAAEMTIVELAKTLGAGYKPLGPLAEGMVNKLVSAKMPGGFGMGAIKSHLSGERMCGPGMVDAILLHALVEAPKARFESQQDAITWLDGVADSYGAAQGLSIPRASAGGGMAAATAHPAMFAGAGLSQAAPVPDAPATALEVLTILLAVKLNQKVDDIKPTATIKALVGGKSALQNEILGDLEQEFPTSGPDNAAEVPLSELAAELGTGYAPPGGTSQGMINKLLSSKLPGGFGLGAIRSHLAEQRMLGSQRIDGVLLHALTVPPPGRLSDESAARAWLDAVTTSYGAKVGVTIPVAGQQGGGGGGMIMGGGGGGGGGAVSSAAVTEVMEKMKALIGDYVDSSNRFLEEDAMEVPRLLEAEISARKVLEKQLDAIATEHGDYYTSGIAGVFDIQKVRTYDSCWNWVRQDAITLMSKLISRDMSLDDDAIPRLRLQLLNRASQPTINLCTEMAKLLADYGIRQLAVWCTKLVSDIQAHLGTAPVCIADIPFLQPNVSVTDHGQIIYSESARYSLEPAASFISELSTGVQLSSSSAADKEVQRKEAPEPFMSLKTRSDNGSIDFNQEHTDTYYTCMKELLETGVTFSGKVALITGCSKDSIAIDIVQYLLQGGATVVATTSSFSEKKTMFYRKLYQQYGSNGSKLYVTPFNGASNADTAKLAKYIYEEGKGGLGLDLDFVIPFAALSETGRPVDSIDDKSELAHRLMTTQVLRLLGCIKREKEARNIVTRPAVAILPLSPNHGIFGNDGMYAESKLGLESLMNKWRSEDWADYINVVGAVIGWTRGTGLMAGNNMSAPGVEVKGCRTFSTGEMALGLVTLLHRKVVNISNFTPVWADLSGGFASVGDLSTIVTEIRTALLSKAETQKQISTDAANDSNGHSGGGGSGGGGSSSSGSTRARFDCEGTAFPPVPGADALAKGSAVRGMINFDQTVVVVGFGEVGPWGSSRTRWEMESYGQFSLEGCIELAWITGRIKYFSGKLPTGKPYTGWTDASSGEPVAEHVVKSAYEEEMITHAGIRIIEADRFEGYNPQKKQFLHEVVLDRPMAWIDVASFAEAEEFRTELGSSVVDIRTNQDGIWQIKLKQGAVISIPRALKFDRHVAGQVPMGWDAARYGVPENIISQVDPITLYTLVSTAEAFVAAGVPDPYEFYEYVHVSEVGNTMGGGMGGMRSLRRIFGERKLEKPIQGDILQESFINVMPAWVNMLLLSASGPIKTPVGACATAAESVDIGVETIRSGKAQVVLCGGYDDFSEEGSYEFANMKATSSAEAEMAMGREPKEHCRPTTTTRGGFMESQGAGTQILMTASLALKMGCPIYAVVGLTSTASDKEGRSVPAPGRGILTTARERPSVFPSPLLDLTYRRNSLEFELKQVDQWKQREFRNLELEVQALSNQQGEAVAQTFKEERSALIATELERQTMQAQLHWGNDFFLGRPEIAPLRGALAVWGLNIDDLCLTSFHGTGTKANDKNESAVTQLQMEFLGRTKGNPLLVICQKYLTGHPKGAAAAWMMNGLIQAMLNKRIPGNRNADNIAIELAEFEHLLYPNEAVDMVGKPMYAGMLKSFGFGQAGAEILVLHPDLLLGALEPEQLKTYLEKRTVREGRSFRYLQQVFADKRTLLDVKEAPPYTEAQEEAVYLNPAARAVQNPETLRWAFTVKGAPPTVETVVAESQISQSDSREAEMLLASLRTDNEFGNLTSTEEALERRVRELEQQVAAVNEADSLRDAMSPGAGGGRPRSKSDPSSADLPPKSPKAARNQAPPVDPKVKLEVTMREAAEDIRQYGDKGIGIDVEPTSTFKSASVSFINRNFTKQEQVYCNAAADPASSFAGRWAGKEAVIKAISSTAQDSRSMWRGGGAPLIDIEILSSTSGAPYVTLHGHAKQVATALGVSEIKVSISHAAEHAVAQAIAR